MDSEKPDRISSEPLKEIAETGVEIEIATSDTETFKKVLELSSEQLVWFPWETYVVDLATLVHLDSVHTIPVRNETVTKLLRLGLAFTRYQYEKAWNCNANRNDLKP